jgi:hypothetical protein
VSNSKAIRYDVIVQEAMLGVVKKVLTDAQNEGLQNDHHFYLTYSTCYEGVEIPSSLLSKYPDEITIVLQHEYENLVVHNDYFSVTLWFNNVPAHLRVPFKAIKAFFDPSVKFGLQFNLIEQENLNHDEEQQMTAEVTSLDVMHVSASQDKSKSDSKKAKVEKDTINTKKILINQTKRILMNPKTKNLQRKIKAAKSLALIHFAKNNFT